MCERRRASTAPRRGSSPTKRDARTRWILRGGRQTPQSGRSQRTDDPRARHSCSRSRAANRTTRRVRPRRSLPLRLDDLGRYPATSRSELHLLAAHLPTRRRRGRSLFPCRGRRVGPSAWGLHQCSRLVGCPVRELAGPSSTHLPLHLGDVLVDAAHRALQSGPCGRTS